MKKQMNILDSLSYSLNATIPVFLVIVIGWALMKTGLLKDERFISVSNKFIFRICLPVMLFLDLYNTDIASDFDLGLVIYSAVITTVAFAAIWICARLFIKDKSIIGAFVQASYRSSVAVLGIAFMVNIYGSSGLIPMIIIGCVPLYNIYAVIVLTFEAENAREDTDRSGKIKRAAVGILKNPIIIGIVLGCAGSLLRQFTAFEFHPIIGKTLSSIGSIATPLSLIVIGASFEGRKAIAKIKPTVICSVIKLIVLPAAFLFPAAALGFRNEALTALVIMLGSPTTPSSYIMAKNMNNDGVLTSSVIAATTLLSSVTLTFWIFIMRFLGYM
ncbi:MAG: AEC family transporter [Huintestinicola sp.]